MTSLVGIAAHLRAVSAPRMALELMDRRCLWPPHDVERDRLMRVAAEASDFEIRISCVQRIAEGWAGPRKPSIRLFHASQARRSASLRAPAARAADARTVLP